MHGLGSQSTGGVFAVIAEELWTARRKTRFSGPGVRVSQQGRASGQCNLAQLCLCRHGKRTLTEEAMNRKGKIDRPKGCRTRVNLGLTSRRGELGEIKG